MIPVDPNECFCGGPDEGSALGLLGLMTGISEDLYCAGWMSGLEFSMWRAANSPTDFQFGMGAVLERQRRLLRDLADEARGWWVWEDSTGPRFIALDVWIARVAALDAKAAGESAK